MSRRQQRGKGKRNLEASLIVPDVVDLSIFEKYSEADVIAELKRVAKDPCSPEFARENIRPLCKQILRLRTVMELNDSKTPWKKRKLEQFVKDKLAPSSFAVPSQKTILKSSSSSLLTFENTLRDKQALRDCSIVHWNCLDQDASHSDESVNGSNPRSLENPISKDANGNKRRLQLPRKSISRRYVIPVGPSFQVEVPMWSGPVNKEEYIKNSANSKWLGTRDWPIENGIMKTTGITIGKGRSNSCSCTTLGSVECIRSHISYERFSLQCDLGPAYFNWKFHEMGEQVSKSWTLKEKQTFESILKKNPPSNGKDFSIMRISKKSRKDMVLYYFNVYIPQRMSLLQRPSSVKVVDTDDEEEAKATVVQKKSKGKNLTTSKSKAVKSRYLRRPS